jgi:hypothetical protein
MLTQNLTSPQNCPHVLQLRHGMREKKTNFIGSEGRPSPCRAGTLSRS